MDLRKRDEARKVNDHAPFQNPENGGEVAQTTDNLRPWWHGFTRHPSRLAPNSQESCESQTRVGLRFESWHVRCYGLRTWSSMDRLGWNPRFIK